MTLAREARWRCWMVVAAALAFVASRADAVPCLGPPTEHLVAPATTDAAIGNPSADHYAYVAPGVPARDRLLVFLPGSCAPPLFYRWFLREAANQGFHAVGLSYPNCPEVNVTCNTQNPIDPDCPEEMRLERLEGVDASPLIAVAPADSIVNRLGKLLAHLDATFPSEGWGAFLDGAAPRWPSLIVAGHSQGAGHAANIGRLHEVARVVMFDWTDFVAGVGVAPWMTKPKATPLDRFYGLYHDATFAGVLVPGWNAMGVPGDTVSVPETPEPYGHAHRLSTGIVDQAGNGSSTALHLAVVVDGVTPVRADGTPVLSDVWRHLLGATPSDVVPVPVAKLAMKDGSAKAKPDARKLALKISTRGEPEAHRVRRPAPGGAGDPTLHGATLHVFNAAAGGEVASFVLPASGWEALGSPSNPRGFRFKESGAAASIRKLIVQDDRITISGSKAGLCYTLDESQQERIGVRLELGSAAAWCGDVPAKAQGTPPDTARNDTIDRFRGAPDAPAPATCPMVPRATGP